MESESQGTSFLTSTTSAGTAAKAGGLKLKIKLPSRPASTPAPGPTQVPVQSTQGVPETASNAALTSSQAAEPVNKLKQKALKFASMSQPSTAREPSPSPSVSLQGAAVASAGRERKRSRSAGGDYVNIEDVLSDEDDEPEVTVSRRAKGKAAKQRIDEEEDFELPPRAPAAAAPPAPAPAAVKKRSSGKSKHQAGAEDDLDDTDLEAEYDDYDDAEDEYVDEEKVKKARQRRVRERALGEIVDYDPDFTDLQLKADHHNRPLWVTPDNRIFLETFSPIYKQAYDFLIAISEPVCRPESVHEYQLTPHSLYAAVSVGLTTETIISVLNRLSKVALSDETKQFIRDSTSNYGKVKLVLKANKFYVESCHADVLKALLRDSTIREAAVNGGEVRSTRALKEHAAATIAAAVEQGQEGDGDASAGAGGKPGSGEAGKAGGSSADDGDEAGKYGPSFQDIAAEETEQEVLEFEVEASKVEKVKQRCMPGYLNYPMLEEYDYRNDARLPTLPVELKPHVKLRPYQEKSLAKMFGNSRARSGIIVLPCGAGKSLVGVSAAARMKKSCLCLCTSSVSVDQWRHQFLLWTNLHENQVARFTSTCKEKFSGTTGVLVTTFTMIAFSGNRNAESEEMMRWIREQEWGLMLLDEVHVVPASMFRTVISTCKAHCKLGLTATLVREDDRISDLNFLIGPKLYEANWLDLTRAGHIANVQCAEVWCPMTKEFFTEYLKKEQIHRKQLLYVMNPYKAQACEFLVRYHEQRGDKIIVFSDNIWALREYATQMRRPFIYGPTSHAERTRVLAAFKHSADVNTVFLSKVGDNSLDIPEANVLIQISSHAGSRRQEAQRLGRILRAKRGKPGAGGGSGGEGEFNAFFYTLVSTDTQEMFYSTKRQQFLIDQGYSFKVVTNLLEAIPADEPRMFRTLDEQVNLLARILTIEGEEAGIETTDADRDVAELEGARRGKGSGAKRRAGNLGAMTGASGMRYLEYSTGPKAKYSAKSMSVARKLGVK